MRNFTLIVSALLGWSLTYGCYGGGPSANRLDSKALISPHLSAQNGVMTIAVADFEMDEAEQYRDGAFTLTPSLDAGNRMADVVSTRLTGLQCYRVVERLRLNFVLRELKLQMADLTNPDSQKEVGRLLGVEALVLGQTNSWHWAGELGWGDSLDVSFRLVEIETGESLWVVAGSVARRESTSDLYHILGEETMKKLKERIVCK